MAGWLNRAAMPWARLWLAGVPTGADFDSSGKLWVVGGIDWSTAVQGYVQTHAVYDPATNTWTSKASHPGGYNPGFIRTATGAVIMGGHSDTAPFGFSGDGITDVYEYSDASNTWTAKTALPAKRFGGYMLWDGTYVWYVGGTQKQGTNNWYNQILRFDPVANSYSTVTLPSNMPAQNYEYKYYGYAKVGNIIHAGRLSPFAIFGEQGYIDVTTGTWTAYATISPSHITVPWNCDEIIKGSFDNKIWFLGPTAGTQNNDTFEIVGWRDISAAPYDAYGTDSRTPSDTGSIGYRGFALSPQGYLYLLGGTTDFNTLDTGVSRVDRYSFLFPNVPTITAPVAGATVNNDLTTLRADIPSNGENVIVEWQLATDAAFTLNVKSVTTPRDTGTFDYVHDNVYSPVYDGAMILSGAVARKILAVAGEELFQGTWYIRSRVRNYPTNGTWSASHSFVVSHAPAASLSSPVGGQAILYGAAGDVTLQWNFADTSETDYQTAYQIIVERNDTGALLLDTGKVISQTARQYAWSLPAANKDYTIRWKMRVWDSDDVVGAYTPYATFSMSDAPTVTITSPTEGQEIDNGSPTVTWDFVATGGRVQGTYRVRFYSQSNALQYDSGILSGTAETYTPSEQAVGTGAFHVTVDVTDGGGLAATDTNNFTTTFDTPPEVAFTVSAVDYATEGYIRLTWTDASQDGSWVGYRVYRRLSGTTTWEMIYETSDVLSSYEYRDYSAGSGATYEYVVVQTGTRFSQVVESAKTNPKTATGTSEQYWLVDQAVEENNMLLPSVNDESFKEEYEEETLNVIGRGRHKDYGTRFGYSGSLTARFRGPSARLKRLELEALRARQAVMLLRNPFGDVWQVALSDISIARVAGTGNQEAVDVTIPYEEVS